MSGLVGSFRLLGTGTCPGSLKRRCGIAGSGFLRSGFFLSVVG